MNETGDATLMADVIEVFRVRLTELFEEGREVLTRPLRAIDATKSLAVFAATWSPREDSYEMAGPAPSEPVLQRYDMRLQNMIRATSAPEGLREINQDAKFLRAILYRDNDLAVRLRQIDETLFNMVERVKRFGVRTQRFVSSEVRGSFLYLATTEFWIETENTPGG